MSNTYLWKINPPLKTKALVGSLESYVVVASWACIATDENGNTGFFTSATEFTEDPNQQGFVPYAQLSEIEIISWVQAQLGPDGIIAAQSAADSHLQSSFLVESPLPWIPIVQPKPEADANNAIRCLIPTPI